MYFFDLQDYYSLSPSQQADWQQNGIGGAGVGCAGSPSPHDFADYYGTARETRNAFLKAINEWQMANLSITCGNVNTGEGRIDDGCVPSIYDLQDEYNACLVDYNVSQMELMYTLPLHEYYYNWYYSTKTTNPLWDMTYAQYINYWVNIHNGGDECRTGTTTGTWPVLTSCPRIIIDVPVIYNYGTSFTNADLKAKVTKYETAIKALMCSLKNMMSVIDGDTFDEYIYDDNGNYNINKIGML